jgi:hypothetical protein
MTEQASRSQTDIRDLARAELRRQPRVRRWWGDAFVLIFVSIAAATVGVLSGRHGLIGNPLAPAPLWTTAAFLLLLLGWSVWEGLRPGRSHLRIWLPVVLMGGVWIAFGGAGTPGFVTPWARSALTCGLTELGVAAVPFVLALYALTRFAPSPARSLQLGASAALAGLLMLHLHCPDGTPSHLAAGHLLPATSVVLLCWAVRSRLGSRTLVP